MKKLLGIAVIIICVCSCNNESSRNEYRDSSVNTTKSPSPGGTIVTDSSYGDTSSYERMNNRADSLKK